MKYLLFYILISLSSQDTLVVYKEMMNDYLNTINILEKTTDYALRHKIASEFIYRYGGENTFSDRLRAYIIKRCIRNLKMGFCYDDGKVAISCDYDYVGPWIEGYFIAKKNGKWGVICDCGDVVSEFIHTRKKAINIADEFRRKKVKKTIYFTDDMKIKFKLYEPGELIVIKSPGIGCAMDFNGNMVIPCDYQNLLGFTEGLSAVMKNNKWGYIDTKNNVVIDFVYDNARPFFQGRAAVNKNGKWFFIDKHNNTISNLYDEVWDFTEGRAIVKKDGKYGFIDLDGKEVIALIYDDVVPFSDGLSEVVIGNSKFYLDRWGNKKEIKTK